MKTNTKLLKNWIDSNGKKSKQTLSKDAQISLSMINKLITANYPNVPLPGTRHRICEVTGLKEKNLFPESR